MIRITRTHDEIVAISFNGEELQTDGGEKWYLPKSLVGNEIVNHLPENTIFRICGQNDNPKFGQTNIPIHIQRISENLVLVNYENSCNRAAWDRAIDMQRYMLAQKRVITEQGKESDEISLGLYEDDGNWIHLFFSAKIQANTINLAIILAEQVIAEIESRVENLLKGES